MSQQKINLDCTDVSKARFSIPANCPPNESGSKKCNNKNIEREFKNSRIYQMQSKFPISGEGKRSLLSKHIRNESLIKPKFPNRKSDSKMILRNLRKGNLQQFSKLSNKKSNGRHAASDQFSYNFYWLNYLTLKDFTLQDFLKGISRTVSYFKYEGFFPLYQDFQIEDINLFFFDQEEDIQIFIEHFFEEGWGEAQEYRKVEIDPLSTESKDEIDDPLEYPSFSLNEYSENDHFQVINNDKEFDEERKVNSNFYHLYLTIRNDESKMKNEKDIKE